MSEPELYMKIVGKNIKIFVKEKFGQPHWINVLATLESSLSFAHYETFYRLLRFGPRGLDLVLAKQRLLVLQHLEQQTRSALDITVAEPSLDVVRVNMRKALYWEAFLYLGLNLLEMWEGTFEVQLRRKRVFQFLDHSPRYPDC
jgi:hypothetical protein